MFIDWYHGQDIARDDHLILFHGFGKQHWTPAWPNHNVTNGLHLLIFKRLIFTVRVCTLCIVGIPFFTPIRASVFTVVLGF